MIIVIIKQSIIIILVFVVMSGHLNEIVWKKIPTAVLFLFSKVRERMFPSNY